jgi:hypothetical protein
MHRKDDSYMVKYFFESNGNKTEVSEVIFNSVKNHYDNSRMSATGDSFGNEEITLSVEESDMPF